ncbi:MAG TPA: serine/threonine-protein kinase [Microbacteriaceae bacterium]|nr:serine/threonine-protein kinase [Microbacteriaceae bacterium]HQX35359.1 serine/threonine-protein kinase [Microbacteriaceae bacterium]HQZ47209.1 serine/threonine-protein kinase [Microbacteriaceae bacterium]HRA08892.1 serine/threonine-protein kinase [Microbacteriaceae bacterium]
MAKRLPSPPPVLAGLSYVRPLGSGGFADVFLYEQDMPRRGVAVKVLPNDVHDAELLRMFNAEADVLARLSAHPSIVTVYQAGISADGRPFIVMEFCPSSLARRYRLERMPVDEVLTIGVKMASAIESAHRAGLVHRDIKPSNILITSFSTPVLADFGISASLARAEDDEVSAMSVPWSAPEVVDERTSGTVASEVWSLGATVYSLLAGHSPFERTERGQNSREHLRRRIARASYTPTGRPDVPHSLEAVLARAMSRDPGARFGSARELAEAMRAVQGELGLAATPLEVAVDEWAAPAWAEGAAAAAEGNPWAPTVAATAEINLKDAALRGPARSVVARASARKRAELPAVVSRTREDELGPDPKAQRGRRLWVWIAVGATALAIAVAVTLGVTGVI